MTTAEYLAALASIDEQAARLHSNCTVEQLSWQPAPHTWSIAQNFDHLGATGEQYISVIEAAESHLKPSQDGSLIHAGGFLSRRFAASMEPPVKLKMKAPKKIVPVERPDPAASYLRMLTVSNRTRRFLERNSAHDLTFKIANPFLPVLRLQISAALLVIAAHSRRHLWQANQLFLNPSFPHT
jgi:hypothetical protein